MYFDYFYYRFSFDDSRAHKFYFKPKRSIIIRHKRFNKRK